MQRFNLIRATLVDLNWLIFSRLIAIKWILKTRGQDLQKIDVDEKGNAEVFRVPSHNNNDASDFYQDFTMRVTVMRIMSRKVCYISKMDPSLPSPGKLNEDLKRAALQRDPLPVTTKSNLMTVTGPANRHLLTKNVLDFCGNLPIYNTEFSPARNDPSNGTTTGHRVAKKSKE
ncbi:hypothetical protein OS493_028279 [Desmophyllum pertusum]|uniref:BRICHOS domain-containing protein n=1 Tax=Desmophyllum pertusum TaxID=174260 RepID=A0A9X0CKB6_9CNID|nr:hypothetical protein OS493_028279 [Desmophyllum pertusum]